MPLRYTGTHLRMQTFISEMFKAVTPHILGHSLYEMMRSSHDFEDVKLALNDRIIWSIELFRSCFTIHLSNGSYLFMLCTLSFLVMAENMHVQYGRLSPAQLKERAESMGYATLAIHFAFLDIGFVVVRVTGLVALSGTPGLAASLVLVSMLPSFILPLFNHTMRLVKRKERASGGGAEV